MYVSAFLSFSFYLYLSVSLAHPLSISPSPSLSLSLSSQASNSNPLEVTIDASSCPLTYLEHAQAITTLQLTKGSRRSIEITLRSPVGTDSMLLPHRQRDYHSDGFHEWPFMTVHSWGENPAGRWVFKVAIDDQNTEATLQKLTLVLFGTTETPRSIRNVPTECHPECKDGCAGNGAQFCDMCRNYRLQETFECVSECPVGTYPDHHMCRPCAPLCTRCAELSSCLQSCVPCHHSCTDCSGPRDRDCTACHSQFIRSDDGRCIVPKSCEEGEYFDSRSLECRPCHDSCAECVGKGAKECTACYPGSTLDDGVCVLTTTSSKSCKKGEYHEPESETCKPCTQNCVRCTDDITCLSCDSAHYLWMERVGESQLEVVTCIPDCPKGFHGDATSLSCQSCPSYCTECDSHEKCTSCALNFAVPVNGQCPQPCHDEEYFEFSTSNCLPCLDHCLTCREPNTCLACTPGFYLISDTNCVGVCPEHLVEDAETGVCLSEACHESCLTCFGEKPDQCLTCPEGAKMMEHSCLEDCPSHTYFDEATSSCRHCHESCRACAGPNQDNCLQCPVGRFLDYFSCVSTCPERTFALNDTECVSCPANYAKCTNTEHCSVCVEGFLVEEGECVESCSEGFVASDRHCERCQSGCKACTDLYSCDVCLAGMLYYKPNRSCLESCPAGYFPARGSCSECHSTCSECSGPDVSQCTVCGRDRAMVEETHTCTLCCNPDIPKRAPCCDCDADRTNCVLLATPPTTAAASRGVESHSSTSELNKAGLAVVLVVVALIAAVMTGIALFYLATRIRQRRIMYTSLNSTK